MAGEADIRFAQSDSDQPQQVYCQGHNVTEEIRSLPVDDAVSAVAAIQGVREALVEAQRKLAADENVVMDGRDIGTVVLPQAECKIFLTASAEERARRRKKDREGKAPEQSLEEIIAEIKKRDYEDSHRKNSPLKQAEGSFILDTTTLGFSEAVDAAARLIRASQYSNHAARQAGTGG